MKRFLLGAALFVAGATYAQNVNIPDANFKNSLITGYGADFKNLSGNEVTSVDFNNDGEIQLTEALQIKEAYFNNSSNTQTVEGIGAFTNLEKLTINGFQSLTGIDASALSNLKELQCNTNFALMSLNVSGLSQLTKLECSYTNVSDIDETGLNALEQLIAQFSGFINFDATGLTNLIKIDFMGSRMETLDVSGLTNLKEVNAGFSAYSLTSLTLSGNTSLEKISCSEGSLTTLNIQGLPNLKFIECANNNISNSFDLSDSPLIENVYAYHNQIASVKIENKEFLQYIYLGDNFIQQIDLGHCPELNTLSINNNQLEILDLSGCPSLRYVSSFDNPLSYVNIKNGSTLIENPIFGFGAEIPNNSELQYEPLFICVDDGEEDLVANSYANYNYINNVHISTYCSFTPGGNYNTITGTLRLDSDGNGCNATDALIPLAAVEINDGTVSGYSYQSNGNYNFFTQSGTFTLTPQFENNWFTVSPATVTFNEVDNSTLTENFCVTTNGIHKDVEVIIAAIEGARPGFDAVYKIIYKNKGNQTLSGDIAFTYNDTVLDYVSALPMQSSAATGLLNWDYANLLPFESREIVVTLTVNGPMETPAVNIDDVLPYTATITPITDDETTADNTFTLYEVVVGSYDPNDITCLEGEIVNPNHIGEYLHYNINFENTGTAPATFVVVKDIIDTEKFDVNTLQVLSASHDLLTRINGNKAEFVFDNINLAANGGKGNVTFKIKTKNTLAINSSVMQKAEIYFDYNWPIITNEVITTFNVLNTESFAKSTSVKLYPNPVKDIVNITSENTITNLQLYDIQGRLLQSEKIIGLEAQVNLSKRSSGIYLLKITTDKGVATEKIIKE